MGTVNFNLRGITSDIMATLKKEAERKNTSVNFLIIKFIESGIGHTSIIKKPTYHDLDKLAGTWTAKEAKAFEKNTKDFEKIDEDLWT